MINKLVPNEYYDSIFDISPEYIKRLNISGIILDLDNTLIPRNENDAPAQLVTWLKSLKDENLKLVIVSNNTKTNTGVISRKLGLPIVNLAKKPAKVAFTKGLKAIDCNVEETAVIGDQIFTDILGGNKMGLYTILVVPLNGKEHFITSFVRKIEKRVLKKLEKRKLIPKDERRNGNNGSH